MTDNDIMISHLRSCSALSASIDLHREGSNKAKWARYIENHITGIAYAKKELGEELPR